MHLPPSTRFGGPRCLLTVQYLDLAQILNARRRVRDPDQFSNWLSQAAKQIDVEFCEKSGADIHYRYDLTNALAPDTRNSTSCDPI
jgi:hypothetical protein